MVFPKWKIQVLSIMAVQPSGVYHCSLIYLLQRPFYLCSSVHLQTGKQMHQEVRWIVHSSREGTRAHSPHPAGSLIPPLHTLDYASSNQAFVQVISEQKWANFIRSLLLKYVHMFHCMNWHSKLTKLYSDLKIFLVTIILQLEHASQIACRSFSAQTLL